MAISKIILNGVTQMDLTSDTVAANNLISPNTAHDAAGLPVVGTASSGGNDFIVTLSYNSNTEKWTPDSTWADFSAAYDAGKNVAAAVNENHVPDGGESFAVYMQCTETGFGELSTVYFNITYNLFDSVSGDPVGIVFSMFRWTASGTDRDYSEIHYDRSSDDLTVSGATVTVPVGLYYEEASKTVPSGTAGTPTATKGTVSNHSVTVTPSVTNTAGYISGGTHSGTAVTVTASELVSGSETKTANGTYDVTNLAELIVNVQASGKNAQISNTPGRASSSTYTAVGPSLTVSKTGTYHVYWTGYRSSTSGTNGTQLYIGSTAYGSAQTTFNTGSGLTNTQTVHLSNVSLTQNQVLTIRARSRGNNYYMYVMDLVIIEA